MMPTLPAAAVQTVAPAPRLADLRWHRRVLLIVADRADDPASAAQHRLLAAWAGAGERDLVVVTIAGATVAGVSDAAAAVRRRFALPATGFTAVLIGKDGGEKLRAHAPIAPARLAEVIDAMPMRRHGER